MIIFTSICANYAHKARTLAKSIKRNMPEVSFFICLTEREIPSELEQDKCFDRIILSKDMWEGNFDRFVFKHSIVEASTAVKARFFLFLLNEYPDENQFVYLDPDCYVYSDFCELKKELLTNQIVLCPHLLHSGNIDMEISSIAHGVYNLGFLAISRSEEALRMLSWWAERLYLYCYDDMANGIFTDQKWIDLAPCFFNVKILKNYGYDLAPWGLLGCKIEEKNGSFYAQNQPIRFVHYSGFGPVAEQCMDKWLSEDAVAFRKMYRDYESEHNANDFDGISAKQWSYGYYYSGEAVDNEIRKKYRKDWNLMFSIEDPFAESNEYFDNYFNE